VSKLKSVSFILKISLFATGCAGIVAEFVLSTLATYLIGNAIFQWTIVMSLMLFAMGFGSRISRFFYTRLLDTFILIEFSLSILCAISAQLAYGIAAFTSATGLIIYIQALVIGMLIGLEIPLVIRLNQSYEELRINISTVMEKDYYGSLIGGLTFAFFALPYLGLTYTPIALGSVNFLVAVLLMWRFFHLLHRKIFTSVAFALCLCFLVFLGIFAEPVRQFGEQAKYKDRVIYSQQTRYQKIVMTRWKSYYWLYINSQEQFSTYDEEKYHEPLVHPAMALSADSSDVLVLGGGDGLALREILKHSTVKKITLVDIDPAMTELAGTHPVLLSINNGAMRDGKVEVFNMDAARFLQDNTRLYGVIIADLPDPDSIDLMHVYSVNFYRQVHRHLVRGGIFVTQATSPYFSTRAFQCLIKTIKAAGFSTLPLHNQIPTMGEWGWIIGAKETDIEEQLLKPLLLSKDFSGLNTRFLNNDAVVSMVYFGKGILDQDEFNDIKPNTEFNPVLHQYYLSGTWGMY